MLPKAHLTLHFRMSSSRWVITPLWLSGYEDLFVQVFCVFCHLFLTSASIRSIPFLSFIVPIFAWNVPSVSLSFWRDLSSFPFYCFPLFLCTDHWGRLSYLSSLFLEFCLQMGIPFLCLFPFHFSSFLSYLCLLCYDTYWDNFMFLLWIFANRCSVI